MLAITIASASIAVIAEGKRGLRTTVVVGGAPTLIALRESALRACWMLALTLIRYAVWLARQT